MKGIFCFNTRWSLFFVVFFFSMYFCELILIIIIIVLKHGVGYSAIDGRFN